VGRVLTVGPGKQFATVRAAAAAAQSGDTIHISAGDYRADVATWTANNVTICGVGGRARLLADGAHEGGKGIWVIRGSDTTVINVEFHGAKVPDENGAGIRQEGRNLTLRNTGFFENENGILTDDDGGSTITIESSEFARNGFGDGYTHNIYVGKVGRLNVRMSYFREARVGHLLKTRARENVIEYSYFMDGPNGTSSYVLNFDNGGRAVVRGNLLQKGPQAENSILITHYSNIWGADFNSLTLEHNTVVSTYPGGRFIDVGTGAAVTLSGNIFAGTNGPSLISGGTVTNQQNVTAAASDFPGATNVAQPNFWPNAALEARLPITSPVVAGYPIDTPRPFESRAVSATRKIGALQSAP
ncbi:MAG: right-handed parallel beta-helix repeat-containing protein, partial [Burkholderiaceae bacterium]